MRHESYPNAQEADNPWEHFLVPELPDSSPNRICDFFIKDIVQKGRMKTLSGFINEKLTNQPKEYTTVDDFLLDNPGYNEQIWKSLSVAQKDAIKKYSGTMFPKINSVARGFWDYEKLGPESPESRQAISQTIDEMKAAIDNAPPANKDFLAFRGTTLSGFREYGVHSLADLEKLEGQFYVEKGFTSMALLHKKSFAQIKPSGLWISNPNIEITYYLPANSNDYIGLFSHDLSYSPKQSEVLLNTYSFCYISNVVTNNNASKIEMLLIPKKLYDYA